jgi:hypothetical protein
MRYRPNHSESDMTRLLACSILLLTGACAASPAQTKRADAARIDTQQRLQHRLAGLTSEPARDCLPNIETRNAGIESFGPTILYKVNRGLIYRTDTTGGCEALQNDSYLVTVSPTGQLCRGDIARTVDRTSHFQTGSCAIGGFIPYRRR